MNIECVQEENDEFVELLNSVEEENEDSNNWSKKGKKKTERRKSLFTCPIEGCSKHFSWSQNLQYHLMTHEGLRPYVCTVDGCGKTFYTPQRLRVHIMTHTGEKPYSCSFDGCGKGFTTNQNLQNHIRTHTGEKPFTCKRCGSSFAELSTLKKHELIHMRKKPYECEVCGRTFTQSSSRGYHQRTVHSIVPKSSKSKELPDIVPSVKEEEQFFIVPSSGIIQLTGTEDSAEFAFSEVDNQILTLKMEEFDTSIFYDAENSVSSTSSATELDSNVVVVSQPELSISMLTQSNDDMFELNSCFDE